MSNETSTITITKQQLQAALQRWEQQARDGKWKAEPQKTAAEVAAASVDVLWAELN